MTKRITSVLLSLVMIASLCACNLLPTAKEEETFTSSLDDLLLSTQADPVIANDDKDDAVIDENNDKEKIENNDEIIDDFDDTDDDDDVDDDDVDDDDVDDDDLYGDVESTFEFGEVVNYEYTNNFMGIGYKFPKGWTFISDEERTEANDLLAEKYNGDYL